MVGIAATSFRTSTSVIISRAVTCGWAKVCAILLIGPNGTLDVVCEP